jgi:hypothetical protein
VFSLTGGGFPAARGGAQPVLSERAGEVVAGRAHEGKGGGGGYDVNKRKRCRKCCRQLCRWLRVGSKQKACFSTLKQDPLVLLGLGSIFVPFILLGIAYAAGWVGQ